MLMSLSSASTNAAPPPATAITNGQLEVKLYLPDAKHGFYRGTRFDWAGVIYSLQSEGHDYYGPWFTKVEPDIHDFVYRGDDIVAGPCSAITGPADEFKPIYWDEAKPGATFIKIGVGALRKPDNQPYDNYRVYELADGGNWHVEHKSNAVNFIQNLSDASLGFGYVYSKSVLLVEGKPEMVLRHVLKNTGKRAIKTDVYNHNFLVLDGQPLSSGTTVTVPFNIQSSRPPDKKLAEILGNRIVYLSALKNHDTVATPLNGFSDKIEDHHIRIENTSLGAGVTIQSDRPLLNESLWSIRSVLAVEPYVAISIEPGQEFSWTSTYNYFKLPKR